MLDFLKWLAENKAGLLRNALLEAGEPIDLIPVAED